jgi:hypothetical protein
MAIRTVVLPRVKVAWVALCVACKRVRARSALEVSKKVDFPSEGGKGGTGTHADATVDLAERCVEIVTR